MLSTTWLPNTIAAITACPHEMHAKTNAVEPKFRVPTVKRHPSNSSPFSVASDRMRFLITVEVESGQHPRRGGGMAFRAFAK
mmetsp:Transcript_11024/g.25663  ORF Transcript_11024/g.25663 Transcript_11024/m.25663 type:complete len:82 (-) Transcript_11024:232-477(-)